MTAVLDQVKNVAYTGVGVNSLSPTPSSAVRFRLPRPSPSMPPPPAPRALRPSPIFVAAPNRWPPRSSSACLSRSPVPSRLAARPPGASLASMHRRPPPRRPPRRQRRRPDISQRPLRRSLGPPRRSRTAIMAVRLRTFAHHPSPTVGVLVPPDPRHAVADLGEYIREQRRQAELSVRKLADLAGVSIRTSARSNGA